MVIIDYSYLMRTQSVKKKERYQKPATQYKPLKILTKSHTFFGEEFMLLANIGKEEAGGGGG